MSLQTTNTNKLFIQFLKQMIKKEEFHRDLIQSVLADAESRGLMNAQCFFETVCEELTGLGELTNNYTVSEYKKRGIEVYGYDFDDERNILVLLVHQFFQEEELQTITQKDIDTKFKRLQKKWCRENQHENYNTEDYEK